MTLPEKLIYLRKRGGMSQYDVADVLHISRQAISRWEAGASVPSTDNLRLISELYEVTVDYLLDDRQDKPCEIRDRIAEIYTAAGEGREEQPQLQSVQSRPRILLLHSLILIIVLLLAFAVGSTLYLHFHSNEGNTVSKVSSENTDIEKLDPDKGGSFIIEW